MTHDKYEITLSNARLVLLGNLSAGDIAFVRRWLKRIEAEQPTGLVCAHCGVVLPVVYHNEDCPDYIQDAPVAFVTRPEAG